jgi:exopolysaccharide/PEP-CTERM locus tyrosine autokinase
MNKHSTFGGAGGTGGSGGGSLFERAAEAYDYEAEFLRPAAAPGDAAHPDPDTPNAPDPAVERDLPAQPAFAPALADDLDRIFEPAVERADAASAVSAEAPAVPHAGAGERSARGRHGIVDREALAERGFALPDAPISGIAEEFRIIKRQLLLATGGSSEGDAGKRRTILVCSAQPNEGKTFCALSLALSMAGEKELEILLVDGDFAKPELLSLLGLEGGPGFVDAVKNPHVDPNEFVIRTDIKGLSVLPAGRQANDVTELLASTRTNEVLEALTLNHPNRIIIFDSSPALVASPASVLASHVGQVMMVVRADQTTEADLREALALLSACETISLVLNGTSLAVGGRRFGSYYGYGE